MTLTISNDAAQWYIEELGLKAGESLRFFGKVYGVNGFSLAINKAEPSKSSTKTRVNDVLFYIEDTDTWFFEDADLHISMDEVLKEPKFELNK